MAQLVRIVNAFFAALFLVGAAVGLAFVAAALDGFGPGPDAVWQASGRSLLLASLAALAFVNLRAAKRKPTAPLIGANLAALLIALAGLVLGAGPIRWIAGASAFPFALTLPVLLAAYRQDPA